MKYIDIRQIVPPSIGRHGEHDVRSYSTAPEFLYRIQRKEWILRISTLRRIRPKEQLREDR